MQPTEFECKQNKINGVLELFEDYLNQYIEHDQYEILGSRLNDELGYTVLAIYAGLVVSFV